MNSVEALLSEVDRSKDEVVELLQELVRIPTVNTGTMPTGNETELCQYLKKKLDKEDIESEIVEGEITRGNLIARLDGVDKSKAKLLYMGHTDTVPIGDESKWKHPPFSGTLDDGRIYGRGADDCKSVVASEIMAMILFKRLDLKLKKSFIVAAGCDEETGSKYGFHWLAKNRRELIDAEFAINEGGGDPFNTPNGLCFAIAIGEKGRLDAKISFKGQSCHASIPWEGDNALIKLSQAVQRVSDYQAERNVSTAIFQDISRLFDIDKKEITSENIDNVISKIYDYNASVGSSLRGLSRMTITPTMASGGVKSNVVPDLFTLTCDVRLLPGQDISYVEKELNKILNGIDGYEISIGGNANPLPSPTNETFVKSIRSALTKVMGTDVDVMQSLSVGLTDSSAVRALGTIVYNFAPSHPNFDPSKSNVHGDNESFSVDDLLFRTKAYCALAYDLLT